jgi:hypothetical protein
MNIVGNVRAHHGFGFEFALDKGIAFPRIDLRLGHFPS